MAEEISVPANEVWDYFQKNKSDLKSRMHLIAENKEYGIEVYVTEEHDLPNIVVTADDIQVMSSNVIDEKDCYDVVSYAYEYFLTERVVSTVGYDDYDPYRGSYDNGSYYDEAMAERECVEDREDELRYAMSDFLITVLRGSSFEDDETAVQIEEDCLEHFIEYIARKHNIDVYRPMYIQYEGEDVEYCEYPYGVLEFKDEDNPIYMPE